MTHAFLAAVPTTVSGGVSVFGVAIPAAVIIAFLVGCFVGHKWL